MNQKPFTSDLSRRQTLQMLGLGGVAAVLASCAGPGSGGPKAAQSAAGIPTGPIDGEISFAHWRAEDQKVLEEIIAAFVKKHPEAGVSQEISPSTNYQSTALQRIRGGNIGDLFVSFRGSQFNDMVSAGIYTSLAETEIAAAYQPSLIETGAQDGTQYGMPYQLVFNQPISNEKVLESAGVSEIPGDWDGFIAMCEGVRGVGLVPIAWPGGEPGNAGQLFNSMVMNNAPSADMCAKIETGEYKCTDDWFMKTLDQYAQLRPYFQAHPTGTAVEPAQQLFATGGSALLATGSYHMASVRSLGAEFPIGMLPPITVSADERKYEGIYNATFILGVNSASAQQATAFELLKFLSSPEVASTYANGTSQHLTVKDVNYKDPDLAATSDWLTKNTLLAPRFQFNDLAIRTAAEASCTNVVGGTSPEQAAEKAQQIIDQRIEN